MVAEWLDDLLVQSTLIRFETNDSQHAELLAKMNNPDVATYKKPPTDYAVDASTIYWGFNGEFWSDELPYYWYAE